jgi:hypothetical protein
MPWPRGEVAGQVPSGQRFAPDREPLPVVAGEGAQVGEQAPEAAVGAAVLVVLA